MARFEKYCSYLVQEEDKAQVCCTELQLKGMTDRISNAATILGSCPSCFDNFAKLWCQFTCSPDQSKFMKVMETTGPKNVVVKMEFKVNRDFVEGLYESCRHTWFANGLALRLMSLGGKVSFENFYGFMGTKNLAQSIPINTEFQFSRMKVSRSKKRKRKEEYLVTQLVSERNEYSNNTMSQISWPQSSSLWSY